MKSTTRQKGSAARTRRAKARPSATSGLDGTPAGPVSKYVCITIAVCVLAGIAGVASRPEAASDMLKLVGLVPAALAGLVVVGTRARSR